MAGDSKFRALLLEEPRESTCPAAEIKDVERDQLPPDGVLIDVKYSSLNYKDGMIMRGLGRLVRKYPHIPGIDLVGSLTEDPGKLVVLTGWRVGENRWGGYSTLARIPEGWLLPLPSSISPKRAMAIGTAGLTAALAVQAIGAQGIDPSMGDVLVTGAGGGVGSVAVLLLAALGYNVVASTGRPNLEPRLRDLGAAAVIDRRLMLDGPPKPLEKERFAAAIDAVGAKTIPAIIPQLRYGGVIAACGLAGGAELSTSVIPFLLRGVSLLGIDSVLASNVKRQAAWELLAKSLPWDRLDGLMTLVPLSNIAQYADSILKGEVAGRIVVDVAS